MFDVEGLGFIEAEEMRNILLQLPESLTDDEMDEMFKTGDRNGDGKFDLAEFGYFINNIDMLYFELYASA